MVHLLAPYSTWRSRQPDMPFFLPSALAPLYGSIWITRPDVTLCAPCEDKPNLELSHRVPTAVGLTFSQQPVLSSPFPDAVDVGVWDRRKLIRPYAMIVFIGAVFV